MDSGCVYAVLYGGGDWDVYMPARYKRTVVYKFGFCLTLGSIDISY